MKILKLLKRIIVHKFWVCYYCFQVGLYWQGLTHDLSKFSWTEIRGALKYWSDFKSSLAYEKELNGYSEIFLHHRGRNPHHYEYWIHSLDDGTKNSLKGLIKVIPGTVINGPKYFALDMQTEEQEKEGCLETVFKDGKLIREQSLKEIRERINKSL